MRLPLLLLSTIWPLATRQQDPIDDFCGRHQHQVAVIDDKLYIDGGKIYYGSSIDNSSVAQQNYHLIWENVLETEEGTPFPPQYKNLSKDAEVPSVSGGFLWADDVNKMFYLYGGEYNAVTDVKPFTMLWYFDLLDNTWKQTAPIQSPISWPAFGTGAIDYAKGVGYYYGGYLNNKTTQKWGNTKPLMLSSMVSFDMNTRAWFNKTLDTPPRAEGSLHYVPISQAGMLVYFGGVQTNPGGEVVFANMSEIHMYDINDGKWSTQTATGDVPSPRVGMCAGVTWANDRSSYNFYMFGGIGADGRGTAELYILTLPSFQWTLIWPTKAELPHYTEGRGWSSCNVVREFSQMIITGGLFNNDTTQCFEPKIGAQCGTLLGQETMEVNPDKQGAQWWWELRNDINGYRIPENLVSLVGGNENGSATKTAPAQGWATPSVSSYFVGENFDPPRKATRSIPVASSTSTSTAIAQPTTDKSDSNVGAIAGGTVGGVIALGTLAAIIFFLRRSKRRKQMYNEPEGPDMAQKPPAAYGTGSPTPAYSPPPVSWNGDPNYHQVPQTNNGEWAYQNGSAYPQTYYPPPSDPSQGHQQMHQHHTSVELPGIGSPVSAELPHTRSPVYNELPALHSPVPVRAPH
ncbi:hypothetical protein C7974DRAFT_41709 [Boeremia exigua]|uniref:uncharacterized protein n=1 Tax=Boeremia exigua TaxID=749465 RepID=UPI001E8C9FD0|nr:uncharacterized protein C7974DRAFT_41709 [Boeremia exigua]KAH6616281.1 hypothetical protein C7974DRAFT_41709 [Boeremia exigua]